MNDFETTRHVHALARRVAALWEGWEYEEPPGEHLPVAATLAGPGERAVTLRADHVFARAADGWRVVVGGHYPRDGGQGTLWLGGDEELPHISIAVGRADAQIAADIRRRFMPRYERCYEQALSERDVWRARVGAVGDRTCAIADSLGKRATAQAFNLRGEVTASHPGGYELDYPSVEVTVYEHKSHWGICYATPELEARLTEALREALR